MEKLTCVAIDDEPLALALMRNYIEANESLRLVHTFEDAIAAAEYLRLHPVDLLFLDINMPDITGLDLFRSLHPKPLVIFTTAYKNYAYEGFELNAVDYLLKPIDYLRFKKAVLKATDYHHYLQNKAIKGEESVLYVHEEYKLVRIETDTILYLESLEDYVKIHLSNGKMILTLIPLKKLLEKLPESQFRRIHRSYAVALRQIESILQRKIKLQNGHLLPVSDTYASFIQEWKKI